MHIEHINVGDKGLYGKGIGSRLLRAAILHSYKQDARLAEVSTGCARLGLVNTMVGVLGKENVSVTMAGAHYGWGADHWLEQVFDDRPSILGVPYLVDSITARFDPSLIAEFWEMPEEVGSAPRPPRVPRVTAS